MMDSRWLRRRQRERGIRRTKIRVRTLHNTCATVEFTKPAIQISTVRMAGRILFLADGRLVGQGTHEELMALGGRYAELFDW